VATSFWQSTWTGTLCLCHIWLAVVSLKCYLKPKKRRKELSSNEIFSLYIHIFQLLIFNLGNWALFCWSIIWKSGGMLSQLFPFCLLAYCNHFYFEILFVSTNLNTVWGFVSSLWSKTVSSHHWSVIFLFSWKGVLISTVWWQYFGRYMVQTLDTENMWLSLLSY
jgi:hypothetical protein